MEYRFVPFSLTITKLSKYVKIVWALTLNCILLCTNALTIFCSVIIFYFVLFCFFQTLLMRFNKPELFVGWNRQNDSNWADTSQKYQKTNFLFEKINSNNFVFHFQLFSNKVFFVKVHRTLFE